MSNCPSVLHPKYSLTDFLARQKVMVTDGEICSLIGHWISGIWLW